jgi:tetratricopeptide (TPR) repeat protein
MPARAGLQLYTGDVVATGNDVKLIIRSLNTPAEHDSRATLSPNTQVKVVDNTSYTVIVGRALFGVKGLFSVRTFYWILGARGTEFEVQVDAGNRVTLAVLEGAVGVGRGAGAQPLEVKALEEVSLPGAPARAGRPRPLTEARVRSILGAADEAVVASQPAHPARKVLPHFASPLERGRAFHEARFGAVWNKQPESFKVVGDVYSDWGLGAKALEAYNKALTLNPALHNSPRLLADVGEAYRLIGDLARAERSVTRALELDRSSAPALNALGNLYFDKAVAATRSNDLAGARKLVEDAAAAYEQSFGSISSRGRDGVDGRSGFIEVGGSRRAAQQTDPERQNQSRGVTKTNLGDAKALLGVIALSEKKYGEAARLHKEAERAYKEAKRFYADYPYADMGLDYIGRVAPSLPPPAETPTPTPTPNERSRKTLDLSVGFTYEAGAPLSTAAAVAAVVSYLGDTDVNSCDILRQMNTGLDCCTRENSVYCARYGSTDPLNLVDALTRSHRLSAAVARRLSYNEIVKRIDNGLPVIALTDGTALVIKGYQAPDTLVIDHAGVRTQSEIRYQRLADNWHTTILFHDRRPRSNVYNHFAGSANRAVELFLDGEFYMLASEFSPELRKTLTTKMLEQSWRTNVYRRGPPTARRAPRVKSEQSPFQLYVRVSFREGGLNFVITFDAEQTIMGFQIVPER